MATNNGRISESAFTVFVKLPFDGAYSHDMYMSEYLRLIYLKQVAGVDSFKASGGKEEKGRNKLTKKEGMEKRRGEERKTK